jgi:spore maturation protein A
MMNYVMLILAGISVVFGIATGKMSVLSSAILESAGSAVTLAISLVGVICLWSGLMQVAASAGLTEKIAAAVTPVLSKLFRGIAGKGKAMGFIVMNLTANVLGLGNASTPLGIAAMSALADEEGATETASDNMILLAVMNTASLQLIPTTAAALRLNNGSTEPMAILPAVWAVSGAVLVITVIAAKAFACGKKGGEQSAGDV